MNCFSDKDHNKNHSEKNKSDGEPSDPTDDEVGSVVLVGCIEKVGTVVLIVVGCIEKVGSYLLVGLRRLVVSC